jgi:hypothetical protein
MVKRLLNFTTDFEDGLALINLVDSHFPEKKYFSQIQSHETPTTPAQRHANYAILDQVLNTILPSCSALKGLAKRLVVAESSGVYGCEIYLLVLFLYQTLPQFVSCTAVEFAGPLHEKIVRSIDIFNQGSHMILYSADLDKSDFKIKMADGASSAGTRHESQSIQVSAKSSQKLTIEFQSKFTDSCHERMLLKSLKMGLNYNSVYAFDFMGTVSSSEDKKTISMEAKIYSLPPHVCKIPVLNPFATRATFSINLR